MINMTEIINMEKMYRELLALKKEVQFIKNRIVDIDLIMVPEEEAKLEEALEEHKKGRAKKFEDLKKELGD
jgi:hypothetical protein